MQKTAITKTLLVMKLTMLLLTAIILNVQAKGVAQNVTLSGKGISLKQVFSAIEQQTGYVVFVKKEYLSNASPLSLTVKEMPLKDLLEVVLKDRLLDFEIKDNTKTIVLSRRTSASFVTSDQPLKALAPLVTISGQILDPDKKPVSGATITVTGSGLATSADANGRFTLSGVSENAEIVVSSVNFTPITLRLVNGTLTLKDKELKDQLVSSSLQNVILILSTNVSILDETVVIGYGSKSRRELTGAVAKVTREAFEKRPLTNALNALQGSLPGVTVTRGSGRPGGENYSLQIRGASSISGGSPLVLIDGVPGDLSLMNPNDIAELTVLKDAAAAIYGARAADGVVLVTTKRGVSGAPVVTLSGNYGITKPQYLKKRTNTLQLAEMYDEGMKNVGQPGVTPEVFAKIRANAAPDPTGWLKYLENFPGFYQSHDWIDDVYGTGEQQNYSASISGGGESNSYLFSAGYQRNEGPFRYGENHSDRYNLRLNNDFKLFKIINLETRISYDDQPIIEPTDLANILYFVNQVGSYVPVYNPLGQLYKYQGGFRNAIQYLQEAGVRNTNDNRLNSNIKADVSITRDLKLFAQVGINYRFTDGKLTKPTFAQHNWDGTDFDIVNNPNNANFTESKTIYKIATGYLDYNKVFGNHKVGLMVGASHESNDFQSQSITGYNFASNEIFTLNLADRTKTEYANFTGSANDWALQSYFGRLSYSYAGKYLLDFTTRIDGSSKFAPDKRWSAVFPSVAASWRLSDENFIKSSGIFTNLKLRASWGQSGNQELSFGNYDYISLISITGIYPFGSPNVGLPGAVSNIASQDRTWETIETKNIGIDFAVLKSRLSGSFDYYIKNNKNMLVTAQLPATLGGAAPTQNIGKLTTKGWDLSIAWSDKIGAFRYSISAMLSDSRNELTELKGSDTYSEGLVNARKGYSLRSYFGYQYDGIIQNAAQLAEYKKFGNIPSTISIGDAMYRDLDGDGKITAFGDPATGKTGDMMYLGNLLPRYTYSSNINLSFKRFDLGIFLQGVGKRQGVRTGEWAYPFVNVWTQPLLYFYGKTWSPDNPDAKFPRTIPGSTGFDGQRDWNSRFSENRMLNLAYLRIKVLSLSYNIPNTLTTKLKMQSVRVYVSGQDLFTFSKDTWNKSFDPEEIYERTDDQTYPFSSVISFGLDIKF